MQRWWHVESVRVGTVSKCMVEVVCVALYGIIPCDQGPSRNRVSVAVRTVKGGRIEDVEEIIDNRSLTGYYIGNPPGWTRGYRLRSGRLGR